jgi:hypothetical protein
MRSSGRAGMCDASAAPSTSAHTPTLTASRSVPPHEGEGR